jgi:hypothetical protein
LGHSGERDVIELDSEFFGYDLANRQDRSADLPGLLRQPVAVTFGGTLSPGGLFTGAPGSLGAGPIQGGLLQDLGSLATPGGVAWNSFALDFLAAQVTAGAIGR